jgi:hypothetical protein
MASCAKDSQEQIAFPWLNDHSPQAPDLNGGHRHFHKMHEARPHIR